MMKKLYISESQLLSRDFGKDMLATESPVFDSDRPFLIDEEYIEKKGNDYEVSNQADLMITED